MLNIENLHEYQKNAINFIVDKKRCGLFLDMGLGKTVSSLTAATRLLDDMFVTKVLVIAPLRVANTVWLQEMQNWSHLQGYTCKICTGTEHQRVKALKSDADFYIINRENVVWLEKTIPWKWDMVIIDESSSFKSFSAMRFKAMRKVLSKTKSLICLTGTPSPNSLMDLWCQLFLIDFGIRLGKTIGGFRRKFFYNSGFKGYGYQARKGSDEEIRDLIKDVCITMKAEDYLELPSVIYINEYVKLTEPMMESYKELEKEFILTVEGGVDIQAPSAAGLANKLLQMCNGAIYDADKNVHELHSSKIEVLKELIEDNPSENFLVAYNYKSDLIRLKKAFQQGKVLTKSGDEIRDWNQGRIKLLFAHPASAGHGLNMQHGGSCIIWFGLNWSLELYQQFNARVNRQGQTKPVRIIHIVAKGCIDEKVLKALESKADTQDKLMAHLKFSL